MSIWFLLWLLLSLTLLYFMGWTLFILFRQKKTWKSYAERRGLRYSSDAFMRSPRLDGVLEDYTVGLFTAEHVRSNSRTNRKLTAIEVQLASDMPFEGAVASEGMVELIKSMPFKDEMKPDSPLWKSSFVAITDHKAAMAMYLTEERLKVLTKLMALKNAWVVLAFRNGVFLLRVDTANALEDGKVMDALLSKMIKAAKLMELQDGESRALKNAKVVDDAKGTVLAVDDLETGGLQLEDDADVADDADVEPENKA